MREATVPCGTCTLCCYGQDVVLLAGDDATLDAVPANIIGVGRVRVLRRRSDGACVYLGPDGCTIYERRPHVCRIFDCREHYHLPAAERRQQELTLNRPQDRAIIARGRELVERDRR